MRAARTAMAPKRRMRRDDFGFAIIVTIGVRRDTARDPARDLEDEVGDEVMNIVSKIVTTLEEMVDSTRYGGVLIASTQEKITKVGR